MRLIDRYVFMLFARVFIICFACLTGIYIVGDFVGNLNEFLEVSSEQGGMLSVLVVYYGARVPWFFDLIGRVAALISAVFAVTWLQRHNEMTALMAAGISRWRIIRPLVFGATLVSLGLVINREVALPAFRDELSRNIRDWYGDQATIISPHYDHMTDILIDGKEAVERDQRIVRPVFRLPISMAYFSNHVSGGLAFREPATVDHPAGYRISQVTHPRGIDTRPSVSLDGRSVIYTRASAEWVKPGECFVVSDVSFGQLTGGRAWRQFASTPALIAGLANPSMNFGADVRVAVHARLLQPVLDLGLFFLGMPIVLARESRNAFVAAGSCLIVVTIYFLLVLACHNLGVNYLISPAFAAWLPVMVVVPWAMATSEPLRR